MNTSRYGTMNTAYVSTWFGRDDDSPMWALNLMKYRAVADYADGRPSSLSGVEADDLYSPIGPLQAIGARVLLLAPVVHQLRGDRCVWDRIAIAQYPTRLAMTEMTARPDFQELHAHKDAGMERTIVMATFPDLATGPRPALAGTGSDGLLLLQVVHDATAPDLAETVESTRIGRFGVEGVILGDERTFAEARFDIVSRTVAADLIASGTIDDGDSYTVLAEPIIDNLAHSLTDTSRVLA